MPCAFSKPSAFNESRTNGVHDDLRPEDLGHDLRVSRLRFRNMLKPAGGLSAVRAFSAAFDILSEGMGTRRVHGGGMLRVLQLQPRIK